MRPGSTRDELKLEIGMFGAEPWTEGMRERLEAELGLIALNVYGLSEIVGPGVAAECPEARDGLHVQEDHFLVEVIDPDTGERVPDGTDGELVFTTLTKEALPLLRYRTGDIASADPRALRLRADVRAHERGPRPPRRHADRPRRQPLPVARSSTSCSPRRASRRTTSSSSSARRRSTRSPSAASRSRPAPTRSRSPRRSSRRSASGSASPSPSHVKAPGEVPRSEGKAVRVIDRRARNFVPLYGT